MSLDEEAAQRALHTIGPEVGLDDTEFAEGVLAIINAKMADAMRTITVKQGIDPREYSLVAFGGAGPMHAVWLAEELEIREVIVPWSPGTFSAWGMLQTDMRHDVVAAFYRPLAELDAGEVGAVYAGLEEEGAALLEHEGVAESDRYSARSADMRYVGQEYTVNVAIGSEISLDSIDHDFHEAHGTRYGHSTPGAPVEFVNLRLAAMGRIGVGRAPFRAPEDGQDALLGRLRVVFSGAEHEADVLLRDHLAPGAGQDGPLVIEEASSTTVVPPHYTVEVDDLGNLLVARP